ncbi:MAG: MFS transporter, partial [Candidatus Methylacidiphilales bacterium]
FLAKKVHALMPEQSEMMVSLICFGVFWAAFEFATIASYSVFGGLINDVVPQEMMGRFQALFRMVSLIDGAIFNWWLFGKLPTHYAVIFISIGIFYGVAFFLVCLKVKEGEYPPPPPIVPSTDPWYINVGTEVKKYWNECFRNPYYVLIFFMLLVNGLTMSPFNTFSMLYRANVGMSETLWGQLNTYSFAVSFVLSFPLGWLCDKIHPIRVTMATVALYGLSCVWSTFYVHSVGTFIFAVLMHNVLSGCFFTSSASLGARLFPRSRFAQYASAAGFVGAVAGMFFAPCLGFIIDSSGHQGRFAYAMGALSGSVTDAAGTLPDVYAIGAVAGSLINIASKQYHYTFAIAAFMSAVALILSGLVYRRFVTYGGPYHYVAPE